MLNPSPSYPYFDVYVSGNTPLTYYTPCVKVIQKTNTHAIALLDVVYVGSNLSSTSSSSTRKWSYLKEQTPIQINYGQRPNYVGSFLGYVSSYKLIRTGSDVGYGGLTSTTVQYTITGVSQVMQSTSNTAWKHTSPSTIAGTIATQNGLRGIIHTYQSAIDYRLQNTSDFKFLAQLADEIGYRFYIDNTDLYFINPKQILDRGNVRNIPQFWSNNQPGFYDTIRTFKPVVGTITPDGGVVANRNVVGLNPITGKVTQATITADATNLAGVPLADYITKYYNAAPAESYYEASQKVIADSLRNIYWNTADTDLRGDARIRPNTLVNLTGQALPIDDSGLWLVESATHCLTKPPPSGNKYAGTYLTETVLVRDHIYTAKVDPISETQNITQKVSAKLVGGKWISSNIGATVYAT